ADPSLVKGGPGRAGNGNFALSDFRVTMAPRNPQASGGRKAPDTKPLPVRLLNPRATFEQKGLPIKAAIDNDAKTAWAIDPQCGKDHAAVFETEKPIGYPGGSTLTFTLQFQNNTGHNIGRPRLSVSTGPQPVALTAAAIPEPIVSILHKPAAKRTTAQMT